MLALAAQGFLLSLSLCLDLGVVNLALIRTALRAGARPALALGLGSCVGDLAYALLSAFALSLVLERREVRLVLWIVGSLALAWLAQHMLGETLRPRERHLERDPAPTRAAPGQFARGAALALASPSAIVWFGAVGGSVIAAHAHERTAIVPFMAGFVAAGALWSIALAWCVGRARRALSARALQLLSGAAALLFGYLALDVLVRGYREFVVIG